MVFHVVLCSQWICTEIKLSISLMHETGQVFRKPLSSSRIWTISKEFDWFYSRYGNFRSSPDRWMWFRDGKDNSVVNLGHVADKGGKFQSDSGVAAAKEMPEQKNLKQLQALMGQSNYYHPFAIYVLVEPGPCFSWPYLGLYVQIFALAPVQQLGYGLVVPWMWTRYIYFG